MSNEFENVKNMFIRLYVNRRRYINYEEFNKMNVQERKEVEYDEIKKERYILEPTQFTDEELKVFLDMKQVDLLNEQNSKIDKIHDIMVVFIVLFVIMFTIGLFFLASFS